MNSRLHMTHSEVMLRLHQKLPQHQNLVGSILAHQLQHQLVAINLNQFLDLGQVLHQRMRLRVKWFNVWKERK